MTDFLIFDQASPLRSSLLHFVDIHNLYAILSAFVWNTEYVTEIILNPVEAISSAADSSVSYLSGIFIADGMYICSLVSF